jgi:hypothetical protein
VRATKDHDVPDTHGGSGRKRDSDVRGRIH